MSFLFPSFLYFLGLISIPIIIHLFRFRKFRIVYFSNLKFLIDATKETRSKARLKHLLILLCRILVIASLVFAFSQPFIPINESQRFKDNVVTALYVDNSFSMQAPGESGSLLEESKSYAIDIVNSFSYGKKFIFITNDYAPSSNVLLSKEKVLELIPAIAPVQHSRKLSAVVERLKETAHSNTMKIDNLFVLSDFQKKDADISSLKSDIGMAFLYRAFKSNEQKNISVDSCWFDYPGHRPSQNEILKVRLSNYSDENYQNIPIKLFINDSLKAVSSFSIQANSNTEIEIAYTGVNSSICHGRIEITDHPITYDNELFFTYITTNRIKVLEIFQDKRPPFIQTFFYNDSSFEFSESHYKQIDYSLFGSQDLLVLNQIPEFSDGLIQQILNFANDGGSVLIVPSINNINSYLNLLNVLGIEIQGIDSSIVSIKDIDINSNYFKNSLSAITPQTAFPRINKHFKLKSNAINNNVIALNISGNPLIISSKYNMGEFLVFAFPFDLNITNFATDPLFVAIMYNTALYSLPYTKSYYLPNDDESVSFGLKLHASEKPIEIQHLSSNVVNIPQQIKSNLQIRLFPDFGLLPSGNYNCLINSNIVYGFSLNFDRNESVPDYWKINQIDSLLKAGEWNFLQSLNNSNLSVANAIKNLSIGNMLWKYFVLAAFLFVLFEILLIKLL